MRFALPLIASVLCGQTLRLEPPSPKQGDALRVFAAAPAASVRLGERTARFFPQSLGPPMAMIAVPVLVEPGEQLLELLDASGQVVAKHKLLITDARFRKQNVVLGQQVASLKPAPGEIETVDALRKTVSTTRFWDEPFVQPVPGCLTSPFGVQRMHNGKLTGNYHAGLDQRGATGTPVRAISGGVVKIARMFNVHGGTIGLDHGHGLTSTFLHLSGFAVNEGATVRKGDVVGFVGSTGRSNAPHLHWSISVAGHSVNPSQWMDIPSCYASKPKKKKRRQR